MSSDLEQTKGKFRLIGRVKGISNDNAYREGFTKSDKEYKSLQFFVETSPNNTVKVELFGMERDQVIAYSSKEKKSKKIDWAKRLDDHGDYKVLGTACYLEDDGSNKKVRKVYPEFDAVPYIREHLKDGDVVRITGNIDFQKYQNRQGQDAVSNHFLIASIAKLDEELDFDDPKFKEEAKFEQDIVVNDVMADDETKKLYVNAKIIKYGGEIVDVTFTVDTEKYPKLAGNMAKRLSFGDFITVYGLIINSVIYKESDEEIDESVSDEDDWGGDEDIKKSFENNYMREFVSELQITSVDSSSYEPKKYKEEDLISEGEDAFNGDIEDDEETTGDDFEDEDALPFE